MPLRVRRWVLLIIATSFALATCAHGEAAAAPSADEQAIRAASKNYIAVKRRGDVAALRKMWTPDGDYIDASGRVFKAKELFGEKAGSPLPDSAREDVSVQNSSIRFIRPDIAIEDGSIDCGESSDDGAACGRFTAIWVNRDGRWLIDGLREAAMDSAAVNEHLRPLDWLLGEWAAATDDAVILVSSHWSDDGKYIVREFLVRGDGREDITATQRIGWDAANSAIKCWTFDSQGGSGEGVWQRDGEKWIVTSSDVLADGMKCRTSAIYTPGEDGQFVSEVKGNFNKSEQKTAGPNPLPLRIEFKRALEDQ